MREDNADTYLKVITSKNVTKKEKLKSNIIAHASPIGSGLEMLAQGIFARVIEPVIKTHSISSASWRKKNTNLVEAEMVSMAIPLVAPISPLPSFREGAIPFFGKILQKIKGTESNVESYSFTIKENGVRETFFIENKNILGSQNVPNSSEDEENKVEEVPETTQFLTSYRG
jgi:hypothetical protein